MTSVDTAWLRMDRPHNLMMIVGVLLFSSRIDIRKLRRVVSARMLAYRRFRQRPVEDAIGACWEDDPQFDLSNHVLDKALEGKRDAAALQALAARLVAEPLDPAHPLWQFTVVPNYGLGSALIARVHHCYADGIALIGVMLSLTDEFSRIRRKAPGTRDRAAGEGEPAEGDGLLQRFFEPMTDAVMAAVGMSGNLLDRYVDLLRNPTRVLDYARLGARIGAEVAQLATMPDDSQSRFKGQPGVEKRLAWSEPLPLDEIKAVGKTFGYSVNDVLLSCVAGALGRYLRHHGDDVDAVELRALVPVNLRPPAKEHTLGNRFGLVALSLPVGIANPIARLHEVNRRMLKLKQSYQAAVTLGVLGLVGMCPKPVQQQILDLLASKATAVMTNVPGPQSKLYLAGSEISSMMFWVPQSGNIAAGVSILSYAGHVQFGLVTDAGLTPSPQRVVDGFKPEFDQLMLAVLMEPWDAPREPAEIERDLAAAIAAVTNPRGLRRRREKPGRRPHAKNAADRASV